MPPLYITLRGLAGSGISTLINTLVTMIRGMFQRDDTVMVCAPTGCTAYSGWCYLSPWIKAVDEENYTTSR